MVCIVMGHSVGCGLGRYGLDRCGLDCYGPYSHGPSSHGLHSYGLHLLQLALGRPVCLAHAVVKRCQLHRADDSYGIYTYGLYSYGICR